MKRPFRLAGPCLPSLFITLFAGPLVADDRPLWIRDPAVSPDGKNIAFRYGGQIWRVPAEGGEAVALTSGLFFASHPIWSPDSSRIAFSSTRYGNEDVFIMPADGGEIRRLTFHSSGDTPTAFSPDGERIYFDSKRLGDPTENFGGYHRQCCVQLYSVPTGGGRERLEVPVPCQDVSPYQKGRFFLYTNLPSGETVWRKHEVSAASRDVWLYDTADQSHRQVTTAPENDRDPVWSDEDNTFYYLSERSGSHNVWRMSLEDKDTAVQITKHDAHPVRFLTCSDGGDLVYGYHGEIWRLPKGAREPGRVAVTIRQGSMLDGSFQANVSEYITELAISPDGSQLAMIARGEVFVVDPASGKSRRITTTPEHESNVSFSPDGSRLLYISHRDGNWDAFEATVGTEGAKSFLAPGPLKETPLIATDTDVLSPSYSPDGKSIAFEEDYSRIRVFNRESKKTVTAVKDGYLFSYKVDDQPFSWSPDGRWLAVTSGSAGTRAEILLADPSGNKEPVNITQSGYVEIDPHFSPDGKAVYFLTSREGLKSADSKDAEFDVYMTYLTREAFDARGKPAAASDADGAADAGWEPELEGLDHRTIRVTPFSNPLTVYSVLPGGNSIFWPTVSPTGLTAYRTGPGGAGMAPLFSYQKEPEALVVDPKGENCYIAHAGGIDRVSLANGAITPLPVTAEMAYDLRGEMAYLFDYFWRATKIKFYRKDMGGVDWDLYRKEYAPFLPHISRWEDLAEMVAEMGGELNASHIACLSLDPPSYGDSTASLGLYYNHSFEGPGMRVAGHLESGPSGKADSKLRAGATVLAIDGEPIPAGMDIHRLLNHKAGVPLQVSLRTADGEEATETIVPCGFTEAIKVHAQNRWVERCRENVNRLSDGRLGFVHVSGMLTPQYKEFYRELFSNEMAGKEGVIVDVRFNGGGNLSEQLIADLSADFAGTQVDRNDNYLGDVPQTRWWKPTILLANTWSYSDGSIFPHLYKSAGLGKFVGTPVPGTGTSVWQIYLFHNKFVYTFPELGRKDPEGNYFEGNQDEPDILVHNTPDSIEEGRDLQLEAAVKALLEQLDQR